jgi:TonB family protein
MNGLAALLLLAMGAPCPPQVRPSYVVAPDYLEDVQLADAQVSGRVKVLVTVATSGKVDAVTVTSGSPFLSGGALDAARQWTFAVPSRSRASCVVELQFDFSLLSPDAPSSELGTRFQYPSRVEVRARRPTKDAR